MSRIAATFWHWHSSYYYYKGSFQVIYYTKICGLFFFFLTKKWLYFNIVAHMNQKISI